jgi:hypothetical protein
MKITLNVPANFNFWRTVYSHGWCSLPPFEVDKVNNHLKRLLELSTGRRLIVTIDQTTGGCLNILSGIKLNAAEKREANAQVSSCFRLDEDYSDFYSEAKKHKNFRWVTSRSHSF